MKVKKNYQDVLNNLHSRLKSNEEKIALVNQIKQENRVAINEEVTILDSHEDSLLIDAVRVMLEAKAQKKNEKNKSSDYNPFLLDVDPKNPTSLINTRDFIKFCAGLSSKEHCHFDILLATESYTGKHYTPIQIDFDGLNGRMFFIDAAGDQSNHKLKLDIEEALGISSYHNLQVGTQKDCFSCDIYGLKYLNAMANSLPEELTKSLSYRGVSNSSNLPSKFYQDSQSLELVRKLDYEIVIQNYMKDFSIQVEISDAANNKIIKTRNYSILYKANKYLKDAIRLLETLNDLPEEEKDRKFQEIISKRNGTSIAKIALTHKLTCLYPNLTMEKVYEYIAYSNNLEQIKLKIDHNVTISNDKIFSNKEMTFALCEYIYKLNNDPNKIKKIDALVPKIEKCSTIGELLAILNYDLDFKQEVNIPCFSDQNVAKEALVRIGDAYNQSLKKLGNNETAAIAAQEIFEKIKHFTNSDQISLYLDCNIDTSKYVFFNTNPKMSEELLNGIKKDPKAKDSFETIKNFKTPEQVILFLDYGIDSSNSKCFVSTAKSETRLIALNAIKDSDDKQTMYDTIKDCNTSAKVILVLKYKIKSNDIPDKLLFYAYDKDGYSKNYSDQAIAFLDKVYNQNPAKGLKLAVSILEAFKEQNIKIETINKLFFQNPEYSNKAFVRNTNNRFR